LQHSWTRIQEQNHFVDNWIRNVHDNFGYEQSWFFWFQPQRDFGMHAQDGTTYHLFGSDQNSDRGTCVMVVGTNGTFATLTGDPMNARQTAEFWLEEYGGHMDRSLFVTSNWNAQTYSEDDPRVFWDDYCEQLEADWPKVIETGPLQRPWTEKSLAVVLDRLQEAFKASRFAREQDSLPTITPMKPRVLSASVRKRIQQLLEERDERCDERRE
jgi:hypothetical protein